MYLVKGYSGLYTKEKKNNWHYPFTISYPRSRSASTAKLSATRQKNAGQNKNVCSAVRVILAKDAQIRKPGNLSVLIVRGRMLRLIKGVLNTKSRHLGNMW